jgi:cytochrome c-type biogenesis protein CcmH
MAESFTFWAIALAMTGIALGFVLPRLLARRMPPQTASPAAATVEAYRRQLADLDRDLAAGALADGEYRQSKNDLERRLLAEAQDDRRAPRKARAPAGAAIALGIGLPALAFALYALFGDPAAATRDAASGPPLDVSTVGSRAALRAKLVAQLERSPRDGRSWVLLARLDFEGDRFADAAAAYGKAFAVSAKVARDATVWCEYADALGMAQGGSLVGQPRELIAHALALDPTHGKALEMAGSAALEQHDPVAAALYWRQLLAQMPAGSPERRELAAAITRADQLTTGGAGPTRSR